MNLLQMETCSCPLGFRFCAHLADTHVYTRLFTHLLVYVCVGGWLGVLMFASLNYVVGLYTTFGRLYLSECVSVARRVSCMISGVLGGCIVPETVKAPHTQTELVHV
jgi:hypothetical protein